MDDPVEYDIIPSEMGIDTINAVKARLTKILSVPLRNRIFLIGDIILTCVSVFGSFALRLDLGASFNYYLPQAIWMAVLAVMVKPIIYRRFGLYRRLWVYASAQEIKPIAFAVSTASICMSVGVLFLTSAQLAFFPAFYRGFPRSVLVIDWLLSLILIGGFRMGQRLISDSQHVGENGSTSRDAHKPRRVVIIGAGDAGALVVREMQKNPRMNLKPICFLDDDQTKQGQQIHNVVVAGTLKELSRVIDQHRIQEVIIAIPSAPGPVIRQVSDVCRRRRIRYRTMPSIYELIDGRVSVSRLREVEVTDLLRRTPAGIDDHQIGLNLRDKVVLITGAGGSIGRELCRQIIHWRPASLVMLGHGENSIFKILIELQETYGMDATGTSTGIPLPLKPIIADVRDVDRISSIFKIHHPDVVFHVAAHKHVPLMEANVEEAVTNNILGTRNVVQVASQNKVDRLVMISSDKAIAPSSVMGATKRIAEQLVLDIAKRNNRAFSVVRFGNVLGSRGSVIPHFKHQIAHGGPVTVTHPDMKRYFMTIPEAVHLILQAMTLGHGGEVFVLRMGEQIRILGLAEDLVRLSGLEPYKDIDIVFTGVRPGEKLSEELWDDWANHQPTTHSDIIRLTDQDFLSGDALDKAVDELLRLARRGQPEAIKRMLDDTIPSSSMRNVIVSSDETDFDN